MGTLNPSGVRWNLLFLLLMSSADRGRSDSKEENGIVWPCSSGLQPKDVGRMAFQNVRQEKQAGVPGHAAGVSNSEAASESGLRFCPIEQVGDQQPEQRHSRKRGQAHRLRTSFFLSLFLHLEGEIEQ
ncbi:hypothetical protein CDAR_260541 [Caerostris darwini]|uniref:Uncharacterized protein n=1 Tax=Caerostris darwini TaxID=1538125 RepID=A0AAV4NPQ0_9ARAC|nr:hypothetical protein CDAR_260541 [Caerostris darwini]